MRRHQVNHVPSVEALRPVNLVNNAHPPTHQGQNYGTRSNVSRSSAGSARKGQATGNGGVQKHGSSYAVEGVSYPAHVPTHQAGKFRLSVPMSDKGYNRSR